MKQPYIQTKPLHFLQRKEKTRKRPNCHFTYFKLLCLSAKQHRRLVNEGVESFLFENTTIHKSLPGKPVLHYINSLIKILKWSQSSIMPHLFG